MDREKRSPSPRSEWRSKCPAKEVVFFLGSWAAFPHLPGKKKEVTGSQLGGDTAPWAPSLKPRRDLVLSAM